MKTATEIQEARNLDLTAGFASRDILVTVEEIVPSGTFQQPGAPRAPSCHARLCGLLPTRPTGHIRHRACRTIRPTTASWLA